MAAAKRSVTGTPTTGPMTTSMILGGIRMPSVPPAVMHPAESFTSYLLERMVGPAMTPRRVTEEPTMPVAAAKMVAVMVTAM